MTARLRAGRLNLDPLFREEMPLDRFADALATLEKGQTGKVLLYPHGLPPR
jgi:Zn-dependent alcohol dehydrogenase